MDPYGAENPAEFFAVASEAFFTQPVPLAAAYGQVVELLENYYLQKAIRPD
jgi:Mlc titration factor MtfA (ptsG expression regulator)